MEENLNQETARRSNGAVRWVWGAAALIAVATLLVYLKSIGNDFVNWDDGIYVYANKVLLGKEPFTLKWLFAETVAANWHPLTLLSLFIDSSIWGISAKGFHLTNAALHAVNTFLIFFVAEALIRARFERQASGWEGKIFWAAGVTALLFGLHPLHVESVVWISERKDVLYAFFFLLSLLSYMKYARGGEGNAKRNYYSLTLFLFILSCMSKPMAVSLPLVLLIIDYYPLARLSKRVVIEKIPFFIVSLAISITTVLTQKAAGSMPGLEMHSIATRVAVAGRSYIFYLYKTFYPTKLAPMYPYPEGLSLFDPEAVGSWILIIAITAFCCYMLRRTRLYLALWLFYIITLLPVIGLVQVGGQAAADRYVYLVITGPFLLLGALAGVLLERSFDRGDRGLYRRGLIIFGLAVALVLGMMTNRQISLWKDGASLWRHELRLYPTEVPIAYNNLGDYLSEQGRYKEAIESFDRAIELEPGYAKARYNRGVAYGKAGETLTAIADFTYALKLDMGFAEAYYNRGTAYALLGKYRMATVDFTHAIANKPDHWGAYNNRGNARFLLRDFSAALDDYTKAIELAPDLFEPYSNRADAYRKLRRFKAAIEDYSRAIERIKNPAPAYKRRGVTYLAMKDGERAAEDFKEATRYDPRNAGYPLMAGATLLELGREEEAATYLKKARDLGSEEAGDLMKKRGLEH